MVAALEVARAAASRMAVTTVAEGEAVAGREAATATVIARVRVARGWWRQMRRYR